MDDRPAFVPEKPYQLLDCRDNGLKTRNLISEGLAKSPRLDEVTLHIDDNKGCVFRIESKAVWLRRYRNHESMPRHVLSDGGAVCFRARNGIGDFALRHDSNSIRE